MKAALYYRISTREGKQHIENQRRELRAYAGRMKWAITAEFQDEQSGARDRKRPGLEKLLHAAARRQFDIVCVFDLSRLTRGGPAQAFRYIERLQSAGVEFCSMTEEHFRTSGPAGQLFIAIAAHIAEAERETLRSRVLAGVARARASGKHIGRPKVVTDYDRIDRELKRGRSIRQIALKLKVGKSTIERRIREHETKSKAVGHHRAAR